MTTTMPAAARVPIQARQATILIVDEIPILRQGIADVIARESDLTVCGEASTFAGAYAIASKEPPDLVLTDILLEGHNGLELIKELIYRWPSLRILVYSQLDEEVYAERALRAGAKGFLDKRTAPEEFVRAARMVLGGKIFLSERMSAKLLGKMVGNSGWTEFKSPIENLSDRELEVFQYLGQGKTTAQIAEALHLSVKTVETHREHIKQKLDLKSAPELIRHAVEFSIRDS